jgi:hypothetical protein
MSGGGAGAISGRCSSTMSGFSGERGVSGFLGCSIMDLMLACRIATMLPSTPNR